MTDHVKLPDSQTAPNATQAPVAVEPKDTAPVPAQSVANSAPPATGEQIFRVGGGTDCKRLAAAIAGSIEKEGRQVILEYIGAGACSQAVKAISIANTFLSRTGKFVTGLPTFVHRDLADNHDTTGMQIKLLVHTMR
jgi:stage V sporulation protein SpoVS